MLADPTSGAPNDTPATNICDAVGGQAVDARAAERVELRLDELAGSGVDGAEAEAQVRRSPT